MSAEKEGKCAVGVQELLIGEDQRVGSDFTERNRDGVCISLLGAVKADFWDPVHT